MSDQWKSSGGIWERKTKRGDDMLSLMINKVPYIAFRNKRKKPGEKNPDWEVFESRSQEEKPKPAPEEVPF